MKYFRIKKYLFPGVLCRANITVLCIVYVYVGGWICTGKNVINLFWDVLHSLFGIIAGMHIVLPLFVSYFL